MITALSLPLGLISDIVGMNFEVTPLRRDRAGCRITRKATAVLLFLFQRKRTLEDPLWKRARSKGKHQ